MTKQDAKIAKLEKRVTQAENELQKASGLLLKALKATDEEMNDAADLADDHVRDMDPTDFPGWDSIVATVIIQNREEVRS